MATTRLVIFDKDGTLIRGDVWDEITGRMIEEFVPAHRRQDAADSVGFDLLSRMALPDAPIVSESNGATIERLYRFVDESIQHSDDVDAYAAKINARCAAWIIDVVEELNGATALLDLLVERGISLAVCTNDGERSAREQLDRLGWARQLPLVFGYDSGHGGKPDPGMLLAAAATCGVDPSDTLMVGDSFADLDAAAAAGMPSVYLGDNRARITAATHHITRLDQLPTLLDR